MKKFSKIIGIVMLVMVIGFAFVACDNGNSGGGTTDIVPSALQGTWLSESVESDDKAVFTGSTFAYTFDDGILATVVIELSEVSALSQAELAEYGDDYDIKSAYHFTGKVTSVNGAYWVEDKGFEVGDTVSDDYFGPIILLDDSTMYFDNDFFLKVS